MADLFEETTAICGKPKKVSNWLMVETMRLMKEHEMEPEELDFAPVHLAKLIDLVDAGTINGTVAKEVFEKIFTEDVDPETYVEEKGLKTVNDEAPCGPPSRKSWRPTPSPWRITTTARRRRWASWWARP